MLSILVSADISQLVQKIIGISYLISADTNNVLGIRGVTPPTQNPNHSEILVCAIRLPMFPALCATASLDATPLTPPPSVPLLPPSMPRRRANPVADPAFSLDAVGSAPIIVSNPITIPDPIAPSLTSKVSSLSSSPLTAGEARPTQAP
jgi:hypothetical protein